MSSNLPPGVSDNDIPGNRPEDVAWEKFHEVIDRDAGKWAMSPYDADWVWELGMEQWQRMQSQRKAGHDEGMAEAADILDEMKSRLESHEKKDLLTSMASLIRPGGHIRLRLGKKGKSNENNSL